MCVCVCGVGADGVPEEQHWSALTWVGASRVMFRQLETLVHFQFGYHHQLFLPVIQVSAVSEVKRFIKSIARCCHQSSCNPTAEM